MTTDRAETKAMKESKICVHGNQNKQAYNLGVEEFNVAICGKFAETFEKGLFRDTLKCQKQLAEDFFDGLINN
jgi:hypothetical protein